MDTFSLSLLPAAADAGLDTLTVSRHVPVYRRDIGRHDTTLAVAQCVDPNRFINAGLVLLLTRRRLLVTRRTRLLDRVRPLVSAELTAVTGVEWTPKQRLGVLDFRFTVADRTHRLWVRASHPDQFARLTGVFRRTFPVPAIPRQR